MNNDVCIISEDSDMDSSKINSVDKIYIYIFDIIVRVIYS